MPSPVEFVPEPAAEVVVVDDTPLPPQPRLTAHRIVPALAGGVFAGLLLVGLGCTPFFTPQKARPVPELPTIVNSAYGDDDAGSRFARVTERPAAASPTVVQAAAPAAAPAAASAAREPATSSSYGGTIPPERAPNRFSIACDPPHSGEGSHEPGPETAVLQGIMAAAASKAVLINGVLYREGDLFGASACPWRVAKIDPAWVRFEKTFGDRVCGVTVRWQNPSADKPQQQASAKPRAMTSVSRKR
jgi:hypothetical protein